MKFYVKKQALKPMLHALVAADSMNFLEAEVIFQTEDWDGLEKWLRFQKDGTVCDYQLNEENCVPASAGMNLSSGQWQVSLYGLRMEDDVVIQRITTEEATITVKQSGMIFRDQSASTPEEDDEAEEEYAYIKEESRRLADLVMSRQNEESFAFAFLADMHCGSEYEVGGKWIVNDDAVKDAGMALAELMDSCPLEAVVLGGDLSVGSYKSTNEKTKEENSNCTAYLRSGGSQPMLFLQGNHDDAPYMSTANRMSDADLYSWFNRKNLLAGAVLDAQRKSGGYGYLDFDAQKLRLIYLNTDEKSGWESDTVGTGGTNNYLNAGNVSGRQLDFLANTALNFSSKEDGADWAVIICSHRPLNEPAGSYTCASNGKTYIYNVSNVVTILDDYLSGGKGSISHNGETADYDFSTSPRAGICGCVHGHNHRYSKESLGESGILSIGCPNVMNGRERASDDGKTYSKTAGTADSTSFCVITVDRAREVIYADHYGAGYDRQWNFDGSVSGGDEPVIPDTPVDPSGYTNQIKLSVDRDGSIYNGVGYKENSRLNSSGEVVDHEGFKTVGFIPCKLGDVVRLKNIYMVPNTSISSNLRISFYDESKTHLAQTNATGARGLLDGIHEAEDGSLTQFNVRIFPDGSGDLTNVRFFRLCSSQIDENSVITVNEVIS